MRENKFQYFARTAAVFTLNRISFRRDSPHSRHARAHTHKPMHIYISSQPRCVRILPYIKS